MWIKIYYRNDLNLVLLEMPPIDENADLLNILQSDISKVSNIKDLADQLSNTLPTTLEQIKSLSDSYINLKSHSDKISEQKSLNEEDLKKLHQYIDDFGLKDTSIPQVSRELSEIAKSLTSSLKRIEENVHINMYKSISDALSKGKSDELPADLLNLIQHVVIDRLENIVKPYEEMSQEYVSGKISHNQFTDNISKNAFFKVLRENLIADITREIENNNLSSNIIPQKLKSALGKINNSTLQIPQNIESNNKESHIYSSSGIFGSIEETKAETPKSNDSSISQSYSFE